jgi:hypothetical protein
MLFVRANVKGTEGLAVGRGDEELFRVCYVELSWSGDNGSRIGREVSRVYELTAFC